MPAYFSPNVVGVSKFPLQPIVFDPWLLLVVDDARTSKEISLNAKIVLAYFVSWFWKNKLENSPVFNFYFVSSFSLIDAGFS